MIAAGALCAAPLFSRTAHAQTAPPAAPLPQTTPQPPPAAPPPQGTPSNPVVIQYHPETGAIPTTVAWSGPRVITDYQEGNPVPVGYHVESRVRRGMVVGGSISFGIMYFFSALTAAVGSDAGVNNQALWIPGIGPFIQIANSNSSTERFFCGFDGLIQSAGIAMLVYGIASPKTVLVRNDLGLVIRPMPFTVRNGGGMALGGTF